MFDQTFDQTFHQKRKTFLFFACLMGDVLFVWTATYQTCLKRACVPRLLSGLYQMFHLCFIKHVLTVWPLTSTLVCLVTKQSLMVFDCQTFIVCPGPYYITYCICHVKVVLVDRALLQSVLTSVLPIFSEHIYILKKLL